VSAHRRVNSRTAIAQPIYQRAHGPGTVRHLLRKSQAGTPEVAQRRTACALAPLVNEADSSRTRMAFAQRSEGPMSRRMSTTTLLVMALQASSALDGRVGIDLYWLPLGAGGNFVRLNGRIYEAIKARLDRRPVFDLYHSGLQVFVPEGRYTIEQTPVVDGHGQERGVVAEGPVGARWAGRFRIFRYEMRRWRDGMIPDIGEAVDSPRRLSEI
jgi:hypothetical protein